MARIAGDGRTYALRVTVEVGTRDEAGRFNPRHERVLDLDLVSASTVAKMLDKGDALTSWAYNTGLEGIEVLSLAGRDVRRMSLDQMKEALKEIGYSPFVKRGKAADRGSAAHDLLEELGKGHSLETVRKKLALMSLDEETHGYCKAALAWWQDNEPIIPLLAEEPIYSLRHGFAGTLDLLAERYGFDVPGPLDGVLTLTDYKTAKDAYAEHVIQLSGYDIAVRELGWEPTAHSIVLLRPDGTWEEKWVTPDHDAFLAALALWEPYQEIRARLKPPAICATCSGKSQRKVLERNNGNCAKCGPREEA